MLVKELRKLIRETLSGPYVLYHATSFTNVDSILTNGLQPRSSKLFGYESRIYCMVNADAALDMYEMTGKGGDAALFRVDVAKIPNAVFHVDEEAGEGSFWTSDSIPPDVLELV